MPINIGDHGLMDTRIQILEAPVSLHNRGNWVADLDILRSMRSLRLRQVQSCYQHNEEEASFENFSTQLTAIDSWEEFLESPDSVAIVRAQANWQARLAAVALGIQRGHEVLILPEKTCWNCVHTTLGQVSQRGQPPLSSAMRPTSPASQDSGSEGDMSDDSFQDQGSRPKLRKRSKRARQEEEPNEKSVFPFLIG